MKKKSDYSGLLTQAEFDAADRIAKALDKLPPKEAQRIVAMIALRYRVALDSASGSRDGDKPGTMDHQPGHLLGAKWLI